MRGFDLHTHTRYSDGTTSPRENVQAACELGLAGIAVTDHDTTEAYAPAVEAARGTTLEIVLGTELSAEVDGAAVHVLGYWIDPDDTALQDELTRLRTERSQRARRIVERFHALGIDVSLDRVRELAGRAPVGRPHIARAVVETGAVASTREVFDRYLADGGPADVPKHAIGPVRATELVVGAGGVAVLAHPGLYGRRNGPADAPAHPQEAGRAPGIGWDVIEPMVAAGLAGIEAEHPDHAPAQVEHYRAVARELGLEVTAGSDFHGEVKDNALGMATTPREVVERLRARRRT